MRGAIPPDASDGYTVRTPTFHLAIIGLVLGGLADASGLATGAGVTPVGAAGASTLAVAMDGVDGLHALRPVPNMGAHRDDALPTRHPKDEVAKDALGATRHPSGQT